MANEIDGEHPAYTGDYPDPDKIASIQARRPCPKLCESCDSESEHHWTEDFGSLTGYGCKHCPAMGVECTCCGGTGEDEGRDEDGNDDGNDDGEAGKCPACGGLGIVEVVRPDRDRRAVAPAAIVQVDADDPRGGGWHAFADVGDAMRFVRQSERDGSMTRIGTWTWHGPGA